MPIHLMLLSFAIIHVHRLWQNRHLEKQVKLVVLYDLGIHLFTCLRAPHNNMPYIRH